ncbi:hypothetical protein JHK84_050668 [Glycine max]|nr:hypothetical protein JHK84_050668 [Glycine max]
MDPYDSHSDNELDWKFIKYELLDEVVGDFNDHKDEILMDNDDNNINDNDDNDIQFLFQPTTTENVYRPYPNCTDVGDNQVVENPNYRHFLDQQQQSDSQDANAMIASEQVYTLIAVKFITEEETKSNIHFVQQFDCQSFQFQVKEIVNSRERLRMKKFTEAGSKNM